jgi:CHAT domain-containing protein
MPKVILVEYFVLEASILLAIVRDDFVEPHIIEIPCEIDELRQFIQTYFRVTQEEIVDLRLNSAQAVRKLPLDEYHRLFAPIIKPLFGLSPYGDNFLKEGDIIWFVPHDVLHSIPLHAVEVDGTCLIERNAVCYTPSASIMKYCIDKRKNKRQSILILADSRADIPSERLLHAREQAQSLSNLFGSATTVYDGPRATKANLYAHLRDNDTDILHIACHGLFRANDPLQSSITLAPDQAQAAAPMPVLFETGIVPAPSPWDLTAKDVFDLQLNVDLVTLSACESGATAQRAGDELMGLIRAFIYAGTPSLIVSLWSVDDLTTSLLMEFFYTELLAGSNKAESLRHAQHRLKNLSVSQALELSSVLEARLQNQTASWVLPTLRLSIADLYFKAADYARALAEYEELAKSPELEKKQQQKIATSMRSCRLRLPLNQPINYQQTLYAHPFYWSAFILVGDWQ